MKSMMSLVAALFPLSLFSLPGVLRGNRCPAPSPILMVFNFVDATNMPSPDAMHMHKLVVTFVDNDHFVQEWTWKGGEKEGTEVLRMERMK